MEITSKVETIVPYLVGALFHEGTPLISVGLFLTQ